MESRKRSPRRDNRGGYGIKFAPVAKSTYRPYNLAGNQTFQVERSQTPVLENVFAEPQFQGQQQEEPVPEDMSAVPQFQGQSQIPKEPRNETYNGTMYGNQLVNMRANLNEGVSNQATPSGISNASNMIYHNTIIDGLYEIEDLATRLLEAIKRVREHY